MNEDPRRGERRAQLAVAAAITIGVVIRLLAVRAQGFPTDVGTFQAWAERLAEIGPGRFYEPGYFSDYPPAFLYVLWLLGALFDGELLRLSVKAISIPADIGIALLAAQVLWRTAGRAAAITAVALWSLGPGAIFAGPYWGQVDAVGTLPLFGSVVAAGSRRWWLAGALGAIAALVKPQFGIGLLVVVAAAAFEFIREARWRPLGATIGAAAAIAYVLCVPFWGLDPTRIVSELAQLVRSASETYPYTSLYAFNAWSVFFDFWKLDTGLFFWGGVLLVVGLVVSAIPLWWRRDTATLLACAVFAGLAFYFLPTRAHERYLFPVFALALPLAAARKRVLVPYVVLALTFALSLYYAFTRYQQYVDLRVPEIIEATVFSRAGQIGIALVIMGAVAYLVWRLVRGDARLESDTAWSGVGVPRQRAWVLPAGLGPGRLPARRDVAVAALVALAVLASRGYRLDWPREMYFDEVYHARTAFELLAQREPYEWTHPHLAKEIMALGILAFGDDRVVGHEPVPPQGKPTAFVVGNDGTRVSVTENNELVVEPRGGAAASRALGIDAKALAIQADRIIAMTGDALVVVPIAGVPSNTPLQQVKLPFSGARSLSLAGDRVIVGGPTSLAIYTTLDAEPLLVPIATVAVTAKTDGTELYVLDPQGIVHVISADTGQEARALTGGRPGTAIAYALGPNRVFVARADGPTLDVFDLESGSHDAVSLANARTGSFSSGATALATVPRTDFLYALDEGRVVVVETHGSSPYASIPVTGTLLGVDGEGDKLVVAGASGADLIETGRHALAWRLPGLVFAAVLAFFLVLLARRLFASAVLPGLVGLAVVIDGSMFAQARIGMNDIYVATLIVAGWYFVIAAHRPRRWATLDVVIAGVLFGLALAAKWAGAYTLVGLLIASIAVTARAYERGHPGAGGPLDLFARRGLNALLLFAAFAVIPAGIYLASYVRWFGGPTIPYGWDLIELTKQMYWYHSGLTAPHPAGSPWWSWPVVLKPVYWYFGAAGGGDNAYIYDAGNVALFWAGIVAFGWCALAAIRARSLPLAIVVFAGLVQYVAWIPIGRVLFFYHFFTVLPFYLLALAAGLAYLWETGRARLVVGYLALATAVFAYFYPFISAQPFPGAQAGMFFILPTWTYECTFYPTFVCNPTIGSSFSVSALLARLALALVVAAAVAALMSWSSSPRFARLLATARSGMRR
ncbi:MAG TPA: phospholipid carrier-dependent glycosyltransferase [Candidatus Bathyarchaeia archaeon]|nr:phospholipid carrier-dependent glycosyltransferase [Candidatus Bathyarchaeia archaeon]